MCVFPFPFPGRQAISTWLVVCAADTTQFHRLAAGTWSVVRWWNCVVSAAHTTSQVLMACLPGKRNVLIENFSFVERDQM